MLVLLTVLAATSSAAEELPVPALPDARFALALYCNPTCDQSVMDTLDTDLSAIASADDFSDRVANPQRIMGIGGVDFGIPDADFVTAFGVGVDREEQLAQSQMVVLAWFASPRERSVETFATAHAAFLSAARASGGWVEDLDTQMLFGAESFAERDPRGEPGLWYVTDDQPMSGEEGTETASADLRLFTHGLRRYGDFELVAENVNPDSAADVSWVLDSVATTLHPMADVKPVVDIATSTAKGVAHLLPLAPAADDPTNLALKVSFEGDLSVPEDIIEPAAASIAPLAPTDPPPGVPSSAGPTTLEEARARVAEDLANRLYPAFSLGLSPGDVIAVNVPFRTRAGGQEYLWVEITAWTGETIYGRVATKPSDVDGVVAGQVVTVRQADVFDYVYKRLDGPKSGNWTKPFRR